MALFLHYTKKKCSIRDFSSQCDQIRGFLRIWPHLLEKSLMENFIFCAVLFCSGRVMYVVLDVIYEGPRTWLFTHYIVCNQIGVRIE